MDRMVGGILVLVQCMSVAAADEAQDKRPPTPEQQCKALLKEYDDAFQAYTRTYREAKTAQEKQQVIHEKYPRPDKCASKLLELVEKNPGEAFAEEALIWILTNEDRLRRIEPWYAHETRYEKIWILTSGGRQMGVLSKEEQDIRSMAIDMLLRDHVASPNLGRVAEMLGSSHDKKSAALLRAILEKNPSKEVKVRACVALALQMQARLAIVKQLRADPQAAKSVEQSYGKEYLEELQRAVPTPLEAEAEMLFAELIEHYLPDMKPASVALLCQQLYYTDDSEMLLRALYTMDKRDEVRGVACLVLGQVLMRNADRQVLGDAKIAEKIHAESEKLLEEAANKYAEAKTAFDGPVGRKARSELFDLRHLSVGMAAPEVDGVDQDGKQFKLSDYRGKVVLLDFWSEH